MTQKRKSTTPEEQRLQKNQRRKEAYAAMCPEKKAELNAKKREHYHAVVAQRNKRAQTNSNDENTIQQSTPSQSDMQMPLTTIDHPSVSSNKHANKLPLQKNIPEEPFILPTVPNCKYCGAKRFFREPPKFCCSTGEIRLVETKMPAELVKLYTANNEESEEFRQCVRSYNNMFAFTSLGVHYDKDLSKRNNGVYTFRVQGQMYHFMNPLTPKVGEKPTNIQLYFFDTEHELQNRMAISSKFRESIVSKLTSILENNPYSTFLKSLSKVENIVDYQINLKNDPGLDQRVFNCPTTSQIAAMWLDTGNNNGETSHDIQVSTINGDSKTIKHYYGCYDTLQYPLILPRGEPGWHKGIRRILPATANQHTNPTCTGQDSTSITNCATADDILINENKGTTLY